MKFEKEEITVIQFAVKHAMSELEKGLKFGDVGKSILKRIDKQQKAEQLAKQKQPTKLLSMREKVYSVSIFELEKSMIEFNRDKEKIMDYLIPISIEQKAEEINL